jgi:hypothetical protein
MRTVYLRVLAFGTLLLVAAEARAGAWREPPGQGEIILGGTFSDSLRAYDVNGRLAPVSSYKKFELTAYLEYGAMEHGRSSLSPPFWIFAPSRRGKVTRHGRPRSRGAREAVRAR